MPSSVEVVIRGALLIAPNDDFKIFVAGISWATRPTSSSPLGSTLRPFRCTILASSEMDSRLQALLLCWEKGQQSPIHDHSGLSNLERSSKAIFRLLHRAVKAC